MSDKIEEIRKRHEAGPHSKLPPMRDPARAEAINAGWRTFCAEADADRAFLLAEVDRQRAEIERLRAALSSVRIDGPDSDGLVWVSFVSQGLAARAHVVVGDENRMASRVALRFKELRRAALEGKP
jgi:hypothetical protein